MKILTGVDFSDSSFLLVQRAVLYARKSGRRLLLLHVIPEDALSRFLSINPQSERSSVIAEAEGRMADLVDQLNVGDQIELETCIETGNPSKVICSHVSDEHGDLILLSAHESEKSMIGPVASRCVRKSTADVVLVRDSHQNEYKKIVACTDLSAPSLVALQRAIEVAQFENCDSLELVYVIYPPGKDFYGPVLENSQMSSKEFKEKAYASALRKMEEFCEPFAEELKSLPFTMKVLESIYPAGQITSHLRMSEADLVVLGTTGQQSFLGLALGSNAERLINEADCSVIAVKSREISG